MPSVSGTNSFSANRRVLVTGGFAGARSGFVTGQVIHVCAGMTVGTAGGC